MEAQARITELRASYESGKEANIKVDTEIEQVLEGLKEYNITTVEEGDTFVAKETAQETKLAEQRNEILDECDELLRGGVA
jgi:hypothetical protein